METFIQERIKTEQKNIWAPIQKVQLQTWADTFKKVHVTKSDKVVELKEDRGLFARILIIANFRPDIHFRSA